MINVVTVVGARPQFIKAAVVSRALRDTEGVQELIVHTGQHYDEKLSEVFYRELDIPNPSFEMGVGSASHAVQTGRMLEGIEEILMAERPDWTLVYGDTNSTLAGALASVKLGVPVAHVEAGLRSFNREMPEEINRVVADHCSDRLFAPTELARENLLKEGVAEAKIELVGDVMYDAAIHFGSRSEKVSRVLAEEGLEPGRFLLATVHRAENTDNPSRLEAIFRALGRVGRHMDVVIPLHPRTAKVLDRHPRGAELREGIRILEPVGYLDMLRLERAAALVVTDSGGRPERGVLPGHPLRHRSRRDRMGGTRRSRLEPAESAALCGGDRGGDQRGP